MPLRFTLRQLEYFVAVGECGSIALAAEQVNVSSPSISAAISQLEAEFGLQLFVRRHAHGLSLTQGGQRFHQHARDVLARARALNELSNEIKGQVRGPLNIGCLVTFAQIVLPELRRNFIEQYPEVRFRQYERDQQELFEMLRTARLDAALTYDLKIPADLEFVPMIELPLYVLLPQGHPLSAQAAITPEILLDYPMILLDLPLSADYFLQAFDETGKMPVIAERTRDMAVMRSLVANGFGYSLANIKPLTNRAPDGKELCFVPLQGMIRPLRLGLLLPQGARSSLTVAAFIDHCRDAITDEKVPGMHGPGTLDPAAK